MRGSASTRWVVGLAVAMTGCAATSDAGPPSSAAASSTMAVPTATVEAALGCGPADQGTIDVSIEDATFSDDVVVQVAFDGEGHGRSTVVAIRPGLDRLVSFEPHLPAEAYEAVGEVRLVAAGSATGEVLVREAARFSYPPGGGCG